MKLDIDASTGKRATRIAWAALFVFAGVICAGEVLADHSMQNPCINCHSLRSGNVVPGSRNVFKDQVDDPLYKTNWYCDASGNLSNSGDWTSNEATSPQPLDCSYCHNQDIGLEIQLAKGGKNNTNPSPNGPGVGSAHPVDVLGDGFSYNSNLRITCNDCHNGGGGRITPAGLCTKNDVDGYPNHNSAVISPSVPPGRNDLTQNPPSLTAPYGTAVDWTQTTFAYTDVLCFVCHDNNNSTKPPFSVNLNESGMKNIMAEYNMTGGGHNVAGVGGWNSTAPAKKVPCYNCHDPHSGIDPLVTSRSNRSLIVAVAPASQIVNPYEPASTTSFTFPDYDPALRGDRALCLACHGSASTVNLDGTRAAIFSGTTAGSDIPSANLKFGFHSKAHNGLDSTGNCLQKNGGCHQSPHNTSPFDCLGCHKSGGPKFPNVESEFDFTMTKGILSRHDITYNASGNLAATADNGCLSCHNVAGDRPGIRVALNGVSTVFTPPDMSTRDTLAVYDDFCLGCHDGSKDPGESFGTSPTLYAPRVDKYFYKGGHGTGAANDFKSKNTDAYIGCLECHMYHGSTAYKLLPGNRQTTNFASDPANSGRVVKGFPYTFLTTATKFTIGGVPNSMSIDYKDYTIKANNTRLADDDRRAWKYSNYTNTDSWSSYYEGTSNATMPTDPLGTLIQYGTSGDRIDTSKLNCGDEAPNAGAEEIGFCNTCHLYNNTTDGVDKTFGWVYTHEGVDPADTTIKNCSPSPGKNYPSKRAFAKDCTECHDPHGSGSQDLDIPNWYMIKGKITTGFGSNKDTYNVVFTDTGNDGIFKGVDSGDELDADNSDDLCTVCHTTVDHNTQTPVVNHNSGSDCFLCHPHGDKVQEPWIAFPGKPIGGCNGCHGYPPQRIGTGGSVAPPEENYKGGGGPHVEHVNLLKSKTGVDPQDYGTSVKVLCAVCHGENAPNHTSSLGVGAWDVSVRTHVDIGQRTSTSWGGSPKYNGRVIPVAPNTIKADDTGVPMDFPTSACSSVDCHDDNADTLNALALTWYLTSPANQTPSWGEPDLPGSAGALATDAPRRTRVCYDCHDSTPPNIRVYDSLGVMQYGKKGVVGAGKPSYDPQKINVAANYYGTESGYGRGGHGDPKIEQEEGFHDPRYDPDPDHTITAANPIDCTACHDRTAAHFPVDPTNMFRLRNKTIEDSLHTTSGLCNECHLGSKYPGSSGNYKHHPSYPKTVAAGKRARLGVGTNSSTNWTNVPLGVYVQDGYAPVDSTLFGDPALNLDLDFFVDWYNRPSNWTPSTSENHNQTYPRGVFLGEGGAYNGTTRPKALLPLAKDLTGLSSDDGKLMCVTCHNPHGTDLFVLDPDNIGRGIPDHNMLRLQDTDNTLCVSCH